MKWPTLIRRSLRGWRRCAESDLERVFFKDAMGFREIWLVLVKYIRQGSSEKGDPRVLVGVVDGFLERWHGNFEEVRSHDTKDHARQ